MLSTGNDNGVSSSPTVHASSDSSSSPLVGDTKRLWQWCLITIGSYYDPMVIKMMQHCETKNYIKSQHKRKVASTVTSDFGYFKSHWPHASVFRVKNRLTCGCLSGIYFFYFFGDLNFWEMIITIGWSHELAVMPIAITIYISPMRPKIGSDAVF